MLCNQRPQTVWEAIQWAVSFLNKEKIINSRLDSEILLTSLFEIDRSKLYANLMQELPESIWLKFHEMIERRASGYPLQYLVGRQEFMSLELMVDDQVLIPRGDTEVLVEKALEILEGRETPLIFDICTGSGAIALALAHYIKDCKVFATDISTGALKVAQGNAKNLGLDKKVNFIRGNLFEPLRELLNSNDNISGMVDVIVSNPPYIPSDVIPTLQKEVAVYEPKVALDGGIDGLDFYRQIIPESYAYLKDGGYLLLEIGMEQGQSVKELIESHWPKAQVAVLKDFAGLDRVVIGKK